MFDYNHYEHVFPTSAAFPYDRKSIQETDTYRKSFNGALFIDRVLSALGLTKGMQSQAKDLQQYETDPSPCAAKTYPPKQETALKSLHQVLCEADISIHHRLSIFYYLLLDFDGQDARSQYSVKFAEVSGVPKNYQILMRGLWLLDHQQFEVRLLYASRSGPC